MPSQFAAQTMPLGQLFANLHAIQHTVLPAPLLVGAERSGPLARGPCCRNGSGWRRWRDRRVFPRHHAVHRGRARPRACRFHARRACWKWSTVSSASRRSPSCSACSATLMQRTAASRMSACWLPSALDKAGMPGRGCRCGKPMKRSSEAHVRNAGATGLVPVSDDLSPQEAKIVEVRDHLHEALRDFDPAQRRRLADFLLDKCHVVMVSTTGIDRAHRIFTVLNARGKASRTQRHPEGGPARRRAAGGHEGGHAHLGSGGGASRRRVRESCSATSASFTRAIRPRSSPASEALRTRRAGASLSSSRYCSRQPPFSTTSSQSRHEGSAHSSRISSLLTYLGWLKGHSDWVPPVMLWWLGKGKDPGELAWFLGALDRLAYGLRILGHGTKRRASRFGAVVHAIRHGRDLEGDRRARSILRATSCEPFTTICAICTRAARRWPSWCCCASTTIWPAARRACRPRICPSSICCRASRASTAHGAPAFPIRRARPPHGVARQPGACHQGAERQGRQPGLRPQEGGAVQGRRSADAAGQRLRAAAKRVERVADQGARSRTAPPSGSNLEFRPGTVASRAGERRHPSKRARQPQTAGA